MSIINQKKEIFGDIAAKRTLLEGFPNIPNNPSFPSINNETNSLNFLTDLLSSLVGLESLKEVIVDTISTNLPNIESSLKQNLKSSLNTSVSCHINPSIPPNFMYNGEGINLALRNIDFNNLFLTSPHSDVGELLYDDIGNGINSSDFNTYLYNVIQDGGKKTWADCLDIEFIEVGEVNNVINVKVNKSFTDNGNNLRDLNNRLIDSVTLFEPSEIVTKLVDNLFGVVTINQNKSKDQILSELKIERIIDSIMNQDDDVVIDNSFFQFNNEDLIELELDANNRMRGVKVIDISNKYEIATNFNTLRGINSDIKGSDNSSLASVLNNSFNKIGEDITSNIPSVDVHSVNMNFISDLVKNLMKVIGNVVVSPKIITILAINHQITYGEEFDNPIDYMEKNKYFIKDVFNGIRDSVMEVLLNKVLKEIGVLVKQTTLDLQTEQVKNTSAIIQSLVGVPKDVLRQISGLT